MDTTVMMQLPIQAQRSRGFFCLEQQYITAPTHLRAQTRTRGAQQREVGGKAGRARSPLHHARGRSTGDAGKEDTMPGVGQPGMQARREG
jgi:hypothetical protein